jgi:hypothetical protein
MLFATPSKTGLVAVASAVSLIERLRSPALRVSLNNCCGLPNFVVGMSWLVTNPFCLALESSFCADSILFIGFGQFEEAM